MISGDHHEVVLYLLLCEEQPEDPPGLVGKREEDLVVPRSEVSVPGCEGDHQTHEPLRIVYFREVGGGGNTWNEGDEITGFHEILSRNGPANIRFSPVREMNPK